MTLIPVELPIIHHVIEKRGPIRRLPAVGQCIYCFRSDVKLSDEHIIADGFGGDLLLPKSSCYNCAKETGKFEMGMAKLMLPDVRGILDVRSRKRRKKQARDPQILLSSIDPQKIIEVEYSEDSPVLIPICSTFSKPGILLGYDPGHQIDIYAARVHQKDLRERYERRGGPGTYSNVLFNTDWWMRTVAKTAHSFAVAAIGLESFYPILTDWIMGETESSGTHWIGADDGHSEGPSYHILKLYSEKVRDPRTGEITSYFVVDVKLFALMPTPTYTVVVGPAKFIRIGSRTVKQLLK